MLGKFWKWGKKKEEKLKEPEVEAPKSKLLIICERYKRPDLYDSLSHTLLCDPRKRMSDSKIISVDMGSISLYNKEYEKARESFKKAMDENPELYVHNVKPIIDSFEDVIKIAIDWWTEEGMYAEVSKK